MINKRFIIKKLLNNSAVFLVSIFLAFILFYVSKDTNIFEASVLGIQDIQTIEQNQRDIAFKNSDALLDIFLSDKFLDKSYDAIDITVVYDYSRLNLNTSNTSFQKEYKTLSSQSGSITFLFNDLKNINSKESFLIIPFSGSIKDILISEAFASKGGSKEGLSIGNLSLYTDH